MKILLIAGGWSEEREVSLNGARGLAEAMRRLGHQVTPFDPAEGFDGLFAAAQGQDFAFINLHGSPGEDGLPQSLLESAGLPYQGSGPRGSFLALNKAAAKIMFRRAGLPTPDWLLLTRHPGPGWRPPFGYPLFVKSNTGGSSLGLIKVHNAAELGPALDRLFAGGGEFIVEPACPGRELTCGVLGALRPTEGGTGSGPVPGEVEVPEALPPILIRPLRGEEGFFDYVSKYAPDGAEELCPAPLPPDLLALAESHALAAHRVLGLRGYSRTDFILSDNGSLTLLETNTLPGMTGASLLPKAAAAAGLSFEQLVARLVDLGLARARAELL
ncbi:MAG: D-alanine--D-alanine ligase [Deltaproteobacteria bacterium]|jgi:D-alanine-D-alanine ligase|nr:D-alanine--D-alanine ligase [Deltaproteobacteria bacterium]